MDAVLSKGGNYLLNIGPKADGSMPAQAKKLLKSIGEWYNRVKEAYRGPCPTGIFADRADFTVTRNGTDLYFHFPKFPEATGLCLYPLNILPEQVAVLNTGETPAVVLDPMPTVYTLPRGKEPCLHIYDLPFEDLAGQVPVLRLTFKDVNAVERMLRGPVEESRF